MATENEDLSESLAAELTGSVGMDDVGNDMPDNVASDLADREQHEAEKDLATSSWSDDVEKLESEREADADADRQDKRKVPLGALHEERNKRQQADLQVAALQQQLQQLRAQQEAAQQAQLQQQQEAAIPDFDEDPRGYIEAKEKQFAQALDQLQNPQHQQPQVHQIEQQVLADAAVLAPAIADAEARFEAANPDYRQAVDHVLKVTEQNMLAAHPGINEQQLGMLRTAAFVALTQQCQSQGKDVAAHLYNRAQAMGYRPVSQRKQPNTSLSTLEGSSRAPDERGSVNASQISDMSEAEFEKFWNDMKRSSRVGPAF